jgi:hypothetical protein
MEVYVPHLQVASPLGGLVIAAVLVPFAAVGAIAPLLLRATSLSPAQLLRRD